MYMVTSYSLWGPPTYKEKGGGQPTALRLTLRYSQSPSYAFTRKGRCNTAVGFSARQPFSSNNSRTTALPSDIRILERLNFNCFSVQIIPQPGKSEFCIKQMHNLATLRSK